MISGDTYMPFEENGDFNLQKQRAAQRLRELGARSKYKTCDYSPRQNANGAAESRGVPVQKPPGISIIDGIPILGDFGIDSDILLILGLLLVLYAEKADKLLLLALLYILI